MVEAAWESEAAERVGPQRAPPGRVAAPAAPAAAAYNDAEPPPDAPIAERVAWVLRGSE